MAEEKKTIKKKETKKKSEAVAVKPVKAKKVNSDWEKMSIKDLKLDFQKLVLDVKTGREKNTSLVRKLRKHIAKELTKSKITN